MMHRVLLCTALAVAPVLPSAMVPAQRSALSLSSVERNAISCATHAGLSDLRAGAPLLASAMQADERGALNQAQSQSMHLRGLRAGELTDHEWTLIAIGALVVIGLILIF